MEIEIRPATERDAEPIVDLLTPIVEAGIYTVMQGPITVEDQLAFMRELPGRAIYLAAVSSETEGLVGIQDVQPVSGSDGVYHAGDISTFVALDARGNGIGRALMRSTVELARERGFTVLCANVRADNPDAVAFYESQGFRVIGTAERRVRVNDCNADQILMERWIDEDPSARKAD